MTPAEYKRAKKHLRLTHRDMASMLGYEHQTARRWTSLGVHGSTAVLIRLLEQRRVSPSDVADASAVEASARRDARLQAKRKSHAAGLPEITCV
jgi:hypothetical protein